MVRINPLAENPFQMFCKWCGCLMCYSAIKNSDGICSECAKGVLDRWNPTKRDTATLHHKLIITGQGDR